ncbi:prepilin peptidase [Paenibacillus soyae]|uniref:A24 family peptidase n=1 Tax=Paenibacillus soyae TaxID=2969249 RepID=A0A9X2SC96_9BACL|nr:A24 family peptidase [Paenibacillus soyae]MCR2806513.1 A24 family peptidase [Paenibacillus soyae]
MNELQLVVFLVFGIFITPILNTIAIQWDNRLSPAYPPTYCTSGTHLASRWSIMTIPAILSQTRRQCSTCGNGTWWRYAIAEPITGLLFVYSAYYFGFTPELIVSLVFISVLVIIVQTDLTAMIIPNKVVFPAVALMLVFRLFIHPMSIGTYLWGAIAGSGALLLIGLLSGWMFKKESVGGGDIKLYVFIGLVLGVKLTLLSLFLASIAGLIGGVALLLAGRYAKGMTIPFGPYIAVGSVAAYWWGEPLVQSYLRFAGFAG